MSNTPPSHPAPVWAKGLACAGVVLALLLVFLMYSHPEFMMQMANQVWSCF